MYSSQTFQPFLKRKGMIIRVHQTIKNVKMDVIKTPFGFGNHNGKHICKNIQILYPPIIPADIFANCCQGDLFKYFGFAGMVK